MGDILWLLLLYLNGPTGRLEALKEGFSPQKKGFQRLAGFGVLREMAASIKPDPTEFQGRSQWSVLLPLLSSAFSLSGCICMLSERN